MKNNPSTVVNFEKKARENEAWAKEEMAIKERLAQENKDLEKINSELHCRILNCLESIAQESMDLNARQFRIEQRIRALGFEPQAIRSHFADMLLQSANADQRKDNRDR